MKEKQAHQIGKINQEFELIISGLKDQSKEVISRKDREIKEMLDNITNHEKISEKMLEEKEQ